MKTLARGARMLGLGLGLALAFAAPAAADDVPGWVYDVQRELMSPFCPGLTLADCPSPHAQSVRMWIAGEAAAGRTRDEVVAELIERYGDQVRAAPEAEGFGHFAYLAPLAIFVAGGAFLVWFLRRQVRRRGSPPPPSPPLDPDAERALDAELLR